MITRFTTRIAARPGAAAARARRSRTGPACCPRRPPARGPSESAGAEPRPRSRSAPRPAPARALISARCVGVSSAAIRRASAAVDRCATCSARRVHLRRPGRRHAQPLQDRQQRRQRRLHRRLDELVGDDQAERRLGAARLVSGAHPAGLGSIPVDVLPDPLPRRPPSLRRVRRPWPAAAGRHRGGPSVAARRVAGPRHAVRRCAPAPCRGMRRRRSRLRRPQRERGGRRPRCSGCLVSRSMSRR